MAVKKSKTHKATRANTKKTAKKAAKKIVQKKTIPISSQAVEKVYTKTELQRTLAGYAGVSKQDVGKVMDGLSKVVHNHIRKGGCGLIKLEGLMKIERVHKPAKKARKGINPFTGAEMMFKAKPAHNVVKVRTLKRLKEMVK
ncbi:MAG: hypothetical protein A3C55_02570 [Gammaproteobacteria bacterium RIFCSPHIGHO2_02_FULL_42_13]|nr:MAG: hypothetical protein A3C55_02570 [Gammaproteobacteria bacterium RIFCSPHIGHO2_02_FULL_42_13]HLB57930.1 HU family DNA-binding protein [Gammaproteobacteria bacterium]